MSAMNAEMAYDRRVQFDVAERGCVTVDPGKNGNVLGWVRDTCGIVWDGDPDQSNGMCWGDDSDGNGGEVHAMGIYARTARDRNRSSLVSRMRSWGRQGPHSFRCSQW